MVHIRYGWLFFLLALFFLFGCAGNETIVVTEVVLVDGEPMVVTRVVPATVEVPVTPLPALPVREVSSTPVSLNIAIIDTRRTFTLDPYQTTDDNTILLIDNLFAGLTNYNASTGAIEPQIAGSWQLSEDGLTWLFYLRPDFYWLDTGTGRANTVRPLRPVEAEDFVFAWRRACDRRTQMPDVFLLFIIEGCQQVYGQNEPTEADFAAVGVRRLDQFVLEVKLTQPANYFLAMSSMYYLRPLPREQVQSLGDTWALPENLVSNGPFFWDSRSLPGTRLILTRNPAWPLLFRGNVDEVNLFQFSNRADAYALWQERSLDMAPLPGNVSATARQALGERLRHIPVHEVFYLGYNLFSPVFRVPEMRRAFGAAINRQTLLEDVYDGAGFAMRHLAPPGIVGGLSLDLVGNGYSPDYARRQFSAAGLPSCRLMTPVTLLTTTSDEALQQAESLQRMWRLELGCDNEVIRIEQVQFGTLLARTRLRESARPDMWILGWSAYFPDAHNWHNTLLHCENSENRPGRTCSQVDMLLQQAAATPDPLQQAELYREAERLFFGEDGLEPITPLFMRGRYEVAHIWLLYTPNPVGGAQFNTFELDTELRLFEQGG
ncbi:MAG: peptide ABC transporter substrate-binding protein [Anaerolineae bacterium]|nr:peptide ABC transporter substrate-binding protein [Anaerolineae bacterium]